MEQSSRAMTLICNVELLNQVDELHKRMNEGRGAKPIVTEEIKKEALRRLHSRVPITEVDVWVKEQLTAQVKPKVRKAEVMHKALAIGVAKLLEDHK